MQNRSDRSCDDARKRVRAGVAHIATATAPTPTRFLQLALTKRSWATLGGLLTSTLYRTSKGRLCSYGSIARLELLMYFGCRAITQGAWMQMKGTVKLSGILGF